jgi:hypothetical protein
MFVIYNIHKKCSRQCEIICSAFELSDVKKILALYHYVALCKCKPDFKHVSIFSAIQYKNEIMNKTKTDLDNLYEKN